MYTIFVNETKVMIYFLTEDTLTGNIIEKNNTVDAQNSKSASRKQYVMNNFENIKKTFMFCKNICRTGITSFSKSVTNTRSHTHTHTHINLHHNTSRYCLRFR